jgi:hypothetical protein
LKYKTYKRKIKLKTRVATFIRSRGVPFPSQPLLVLLCKEEGLEKNEALPFLNWNHPIWFILLVRAIAQPISEYSVVRQLMALKRSGELSMVYDIGMKLERVADGSGCEFH